jgi:hypothetical protein
MATARCHPAAARTLRTAGWCGLALLLPSLSPAAQEAVGGLPVPPDILVNPRRTAAFAAAVISGLLLLQYGHRRQPCCGCSRTS